MSATTESILQELHRLETHLENARSAGDLHTESLIISQMEILKKSLMTAATALNESKQILKG